MKTFIQLYNGFILGIIDSYGAAHSHYSEECKFHEEIWPGKSHCCWRWDYFDGLKCGFSLQKLTPEERQTIERHLEKRFAIKFWDNGHHDLDFFNEKLKKEGFEF